MLSRVAVGDVECSLTGCWEIAGVVIAGTWRSSDPGALLEHVHVAPSCPMHAEDVMTLVREESTGCLDVEVMVFPIDFLPELAGTVAAGMPIGRDF